MYVRNVRGSINMKLNRVFRFRIEYEYDDYDFRLTASIYNFSWYYSGDGILKLILDLEYPTIAVARVCGLKILCIDVYSSARYEDISEYIELIRHILGLSEDLTAFYKLWRTDKLLSKSMSYLAGFRVRASPLWISLLIGVCQQNASFKQGWKMLSNLFKLFGESYLIPPFGEVLIPPRPSDIFRINISELMKAGIGYRAKTIHNIAEEFVRGNITNDFRDCHNPESLKTINGVGNYTARLANVLTYRKYNEPPIDRWLAKIISHVYNVPVNDTERYWEKYWGSWSGLASILATIALDAEPLSKAIKRIDEGLVYPSTNDMSPLNLWRYI